MAENRSGVVGGIIAGVGGLILVTIIILVIVSTVNDSHLLRATETTTSVTNESAPVNSTGTVLDTFDARNRDYAIVTMVNASHTEVLTSANVTFDSTTGTLTNATAQTFSYIIVNYTYVATSNYELTTDGMSGNFTSGINNVSSKIPTILLIAAVVLLFGVIVLLVRQSQAMGIGNKSSL